MASVPIIENPTKRRRRTRRSKPKKRRARRNPDLATLATNPRRKRRYYRRAPRRRTRRYYRRRSNPLKLGGFFRSIDLPTAAGVTGGLLTARLAPGLIQKAWRGVPTVGPLSYVVRIGSTLVVAYVVRKVSRSAATANAIVVGGVAYVLMDLANRYLLPKLAPALGLSGVGTYVSYRDVQRITGPSAAIRRVPVRALTDMSLAA